jgi:hypothetical protein
MPNTVADDDETKTNEVAFVYPTGTTVVDQIVTTMDVSTISRAAEWVEEELKIKTKDSLWFERLGYTLLAVEFNDEAITAFQQSRDLPDRHLRSVRGLAEAYGAKGELALAIKEIDCVIEELRARGKNESALEEDRADLLLALRLKAGWHLKSEPPNRETAIALYREVLEIDPGDYGSQWKLFKALADSSYSTDALELLRAFSARPANKIGDLDQLAEMLLNFRFDDLDNVVNIETFDLVVSVTANDPISSSILENLKLCIDLAHKENNAAALIRLLLLQGVALFHYNFNSTDQKEAIISWKKCCSMGFKNFADLASNVNTVEMVAGVLLAVRRISIYYHGLAKKGGPDEQEHITELQEFYSVAQKHYWTAQPVRFALAAYHTSSQAPEKARDLLLNDMKTALDLLSDDDPDNDFQGYVAIAEAALHAGDDLNALTAWSLLLPDDVDEDEHPAEDDEVEHSDDEDEDEHPDNEDEGEHPDDEDEVEHADDSSSASSGCSSSSTANIPEVAVVIPKLDIPETNGVNLKSKLRTGKLGNVCDGGCGTVWPYADDFYSCKVCCDVQFESRCLNKLREGTLKRVICSPEHDWLHIPPFSDEEYHRVGKGNVLMGGTLVNGARQGGDIVPISDWLDTLRHQWGIPHEEKDTNEEST